MKKTFISLVYLELWFYVFKSRKTDNDFCKSTVLTKIITSRQRVQLN